MPTSLSFAEHLVVKEMIHGLPDGAAGRDYDWNELLDVALQAVSPANPEPPVSDRRSRSRPPASRAPS